MSVRKTQHGKAKIEGIVVGGGRRSTFGPGHTKALLLGVIGILLLIGVMLGTYYLVRGHVNTVKKQAAAQQAAQAQHAGDPIGDLALNGKYDDAQTQLAAQQAAATSKDTKTGLYFQQATLALNDKKYPEALAFAKALDALNPTSASAELYAQIAAAQGDKVTATSYFNQAISRVDKTMPNGQGKINDYKAELAELQK